MKTESHEQNVRYRGMDLWLGFFLCALTSSNFCTVTVTVDVHSFIRAGDFPRGFFPRVSRGELVNLDARGPRDARRATREGKSRENRGKIVARGSFVALARPWTRARERVDGTRRRAPVDEKVHSRVDLVLFWIFSRGTSWGYRL